MSSSLDPNNTETSNTETSNTETSNTETSNTVEAIGKNSDSILSSTGGWTKEFERRRTRAKTMAGKIEQLSRGVSTQGEVSKKLTESIKSINNRMKEKLETKKKPGFIQGMNKSMKATSPWKRALIGGAAGSIVPVFGNIGGAFVGYFYDKLPLGSIIDEEDVFKELAEGGLGELMNQHNEFVEGVGGQSNQLQEVQNQIKSIVHSLQEEITLIEESLDSFGEQEKVIQTDRLRGLKEEKATFEVQIKNLQDLQELFKISVIDVMQSFPNAVSHIAAGVTTYNVGKSIQNIAETGEGIRTLANSSLQASFDITAQISEGLEKRSLEGGSIINETTIEAIVASSAITDANMKKLREQSGKQLSGPSPALLALRNLSKKD